MDEVTRSVRWEAPEHQHIEKTSDWYWILGIVAVAGSVASILLGNTLFGVVILLAAATMIIFSHSEPKMLVFEVSGRGVRCGNEFTPYTQLEAFYLDEESPKGPMLILKQEHVLSQLILMPLPEECVQDIDDIVSAKLPEEHLEEPFSQRILEFLGF